MYLGNWSSFEDMCSDFQVDEGEVRAQVDKVLVAWYGNGDYCGSALVFYRGRDGKYYTVSASHCSCNGVGGQWNNPVAANLEELAGLASDPEWESNYTGADDLRRCMSEVVEDILFPDPRSQEVRRVLINADIQRVIRVPMKAGPAGTRGLHKDSAEHARLMQAELEKAKNLLADQYPDIRLEWVMSSGGSGYLTIKKEVQ